MANRERSKVSVSERAMPHNLDAERSILGAILIDNEAYAVVSAGIEPTLFFRDAHRTVYRHMVALAKNHEAIDLVTVVDSLRRTGEDDAVGGPAYVASLVDGVPKATNVASYVKIVREAATRRELIVRLSQSIESSYAWHGPIEELLEKATLDVASLVPPNVTAQADRFISARDTCGVPRV